MRAPYQIFIPFLSLFLVRVDLTDLYPLEIRSTLMEVRDGDTLRVKVFGHVRLLRLMYIDAPELSQGVVGQESKKCLEKIVRGKSRFYLHGFDFYQRLLGTIDSHEKIVSEGCSGLYVRASFLSRKMKGDYLRRLLKAREERVGIWSKESFLRPDLYRKLSKRNARQR